MARALFVIFLVIPFFQAFSDWREDFIKNLKNGGALVVDDSGREVLAHKKDELFIPASIQKIATSYCALSDVGPEFRFSTRFYLGANEELIIQGMGDPSLVSEELMVIAQKLVEKKKTYRSLILDTSYFEPEIRIDGTSHSTNPYDAPNGALLANFHTAYLEKTKKGQIISAEPQTPLTALSVKAGARIKGARERINLGKDSKSGAIYLGELLSKFIQTAGGKITGEIIVAKSPVNARLLHEHISGKSLEEVVKGLLEFSTNFTANQVLLVLGAKKYGAPASIEKGQAWLRSCLKEKLGWKASSIEEGSGLSRKNQVTPGEFIRLLKAFSPYRNLLKKEGAFLAKTGTLTGVNSYGGYFLSPEGREYTFVYMVNSVVPHDYKFRLAKELYSGIARELTSGK